MPMITRIAIEEVFALQKRREEINRFSLNQIIWTKNGEPLRPDRAKIDSWELTGLTNIDFVTSGEAERQGD